MPTNIFISLCENDTHGRRSGRLHQIWCAMPDGEMFLHLESREFMHGATINTSNNIPGSIRYAGDIFAYTSVQDWAGNIMWNLYEFPLNIALGFINCIMEEQEFTVSEAIEDVFSKFKNREPLSASDLGIEMENASYPVVFNPNQLNLFTHP